MQASLLVMPMSPCPHAVPPICLHPDSLSSDTSHAESEPTLTASCSLTAHVWTLSPQNYFAVLNVEVSTRDLNEGTHSGA